MTAATAGYRLALALQGMSPPGGGELIGLYWQSGECHPRVAVHASPMYPLPRAECSLTWLRGRGRQRRGADVEAKTRGRFGDDAGTGGQAA